MASCHVCRHARHVFADVFAGVVSLCVAVNVRWIRTESYGISSGCDDIHYDSHGNGRLDTEIGRAADSSAVPTAKIPDDASAFVFACGMFLPPDSAELTRKTM